MSYYFCIYPLKQISDLLGQLALAFSSQRMRTGVVIAVTAVIAAMDLTALEATAMATATATATVTPVRTRTAGTAEIVEAVLMEALLGTLFGAFAKMMPQD